MATRRDSPSTRIRDEQGARELRELHRQFDHQMGVLKNKLARGPRRGETVDEFVTPLVRRFASIVHRVSRRQIAILLASFARGPHRRGPGRPRTRALRVETRTILDGWRPPRKGRPNEHDVDDEEIVDLVDKWRADAKEPLSDARALAELLFYNAPPKIRKQLEHKRADYERRAETAHARKDALRRAVVDVEPLGKGANLDWWVKRLDRARRNLRRRF